MAATERTSGSRVAASDYAVRSRSGLRRGCASCRAQSFARLGMAALVSTAACVQAPDDGLQVDEVDAAFGVAYSSRDAGASQEPTASDPANGEEDAVDDGDPGAADGAASSGPAPAPVDAGPPPRMCKNLAAFTAEVTPHVIERCVRCHDGTKAKATKTLDLTSGRDTSPAGQQRACDQMLRGAPDSSEQSPIFAEVNPGNPMTVHDFKYPSAMTYMAYRDAVLAWLQGE